jgi:hypothetical protein
MAAFIFHHLWFEESRKWMSNLITVCCGETTSNLTVGEFMNFCRRRGGFTQITD